MPDANVIADVSETLRRVVETGVAGVLPPGRVFIHNLQTLPQPPALTLFLFDIIEDPSARNRARVRETLPDRVRIRKPKITLLLRYMITAWVADLNEFPFPYTDQLILGRVTLTLYEKPIIAGPDLFGASLAGGTEVIKVTMVPLMLEERTRVWEALQKPYRLSLVYEVRVINIDTAASQVSWPVRSRQLDHGDLVPEGTP